VAVLERWTEVPGATSAYGCDGDDRDHCAAWLATDPTTPIFEWACWGDVVRPERLDGEAEGLEGEDGLRAGVTRADGHELAWLWVKPSAQVHAAVLDPRRAPGAGATLARRSVEAAPYFGLDGPDALRELRPLPLVRGPRGRPELWFAVTFAGARDAVLHAPGQASGRRVRARIPAAPSARERDGWVRASWSPPAALSRDVTGTLTPARRRASVSHQPGARGGSGYPARMTGTGGEGRTARAEAREAVRPRAGAGSERSRAARSLLAPSLLAPSFLALSLAALGPVANARAEEPIFVSPPASPTRVSVGLTLLGLGRISPPSEAFPTFDATWMLTATWSDPRLRFEPAPGAPTEHVYIGPAAAHELERIWWPDLEIENEEGTATLHGRTVVVSADGAVRYEAIFDGRFRTTFDLRAFPFDAQSLVMKVEPGAWDVSQVVLTPLPERLVVAHEEHLQDWDVLGLSHAVAEVDEPRSARRFSALTAEVRVRRHPGFYLGKVMLPLLLVIAFTWTTFWMTGEAAGTRMQRGFIALLSIVAFTQVVAQHLPRIGQVTFLDAVLYLAFAFTGATLLQIIATHRAAEAGDKARAAALDRVCRWAFPAAFALAMTVLAFIYVPR
jgi:hypothetical protein